MPRGVAEFSGPFRPTEPLRPPAVGADPLLHELHTGNEALRRALVPHVRVLEGRARIDGTTGFAWSGTGLLNLPFVDDRGRLEVLLRGSLARTMTARGRTDLGSSAFLLHHMWETTHYHFFLDLLPQLACLEALGLRRIVVTSRLAEDARFQRFVVGNPRMPECEVIRVDHVGEITNVAVARSPWPSPETVAWVRRRVAPSGPRTRDTHILLLREQGSGRAILNANEIVEIAERHGLTVVTADNLSLEDQIRVFSAARTVVGVHGAGLTNALFRTGRDLTLLELVPSEMVHPFYLNLAACLGADYRGLRVSSEPTNADFRRWNVYVDPSAFERALDSVLGSQGP
jgi:capsular polysaccharide biosynthesis protein